MRAIFLIAWREYRQYILSRGFLLFLVVFPLGLLFIAAALTALGKADPVRAYVVYDETGVYAEALEAEMRLQREHEILSAWDAYVELAVRKDARDSNAIPWPFAPAPMSRRRLDAFAAAGLDAAKASVAPYVRAGAPAFAPPRERFVRLSLPPEAAAATNVAGAVEALRPYLLGARPLGDEPLFAAILIPKDFGTSEDAPHAEYWSRNLTDTSLHAAVRRALDAAVQKRAAAEIGVSKSALEEIAALEASLKGYRADRADEAAELSLFDRIETTLPAMLTYMLLVIVFGVGNLLLTNTIEERSNKIVEMLLAAVTPGQLMLGKLVGIAAVGLTMPTIFALAGLVVAVAGGQGEWATEASRALLSANLLAVYLFYFLCAYMIFAMIFLAIGAMSNSLQDAQSFMGPVMLLVFLPIPFMLMVYQNPNGLIASVLTFIPIYTPFAVMMRAASDPPFWEILAATALMLAFAVALSSAMGRIFRRAILQSAPVRGGEIFRLLRRTD